jgi:NTP pyrophosphatase (non-canonical NTP hydrolase)
MNIKELQKWTKKFDKLAGVDDEGQGIPIALHAAEEMGEVAQCILKLSGWKKPKGETVEHLGEEIADVISLMVKLANHYDIDLTERIQNNQEKLQKRWGITVDK